MKKLYSFLLLFSAFSGHTQTYYPLPLENVIWEEYEYVTSVPCLNQTWIIYYTDGDTIISSNHYSKLYRESNNVVECGSHAPPFEIIEHKTYSCALRQDTINKTVFIVRSGESDETLLYDFNLEIGDTIFLDGNYYADVDSIDSVIVKGEPHRRMWYYVEYPYEGNYKESAIIEGIGNNRGIVLPIVKLNWYKEITCVSVNDDHLFGTNGACCQPGDTCGTILPSPLDPEEPDSTEDEGVDSTNTGITFSIPNTHFIGSGYQDYPLTVYINYISDKPLKLLIYNLLGEIVMNRMVSPHQSFTLSHNEFSTGIYFFALFEEDKLVLTRQLFW